jgi:glycosyltransferase involved in cell wall biosynthesis
MAAYDGEKYITRQVESILSQLGTQDELIISVDPSADRTKRIAQDFAASDARVVVLDGPGQGVIRNFENALRAVQGAVIFLSDQDDVWHPAKLCSCLAALREDGVRAVVHDAVVVDGNLNEIQSSYFDKGFSSGVWRNVMRNRYIGCCMAVRREVLDAALPFPPRIPMHDQWLGLTARRMGKVAYVGKPLVFYRRHNRTVTGRKKAGWITRLRWRLGIVSALAQLSERIRAVLHKDKESVRS